MTKARMREPVNFDSWRSSVFNASAKPLCSGWHKCAQWLALHIATLFSSINMPVTSPFNSEATVVFAKTAAGQKEIQDRSIGLTLLQRRLLLLMNGQRRLSELSELMPGQDLQPLLQTLQEKACVEQVSSPLRRTANAESTTDGKASSAAANSMSGLPPADQRTTAQNEMARNFMINTINTVFGQYTRLTLIETISHANGTDGLRQAYFMWSSALEENRVGAKRLPDFQSQLFKVL